MTQGKQVRQLGATGLVVSPLGLGTNRWAYGKNDEAVLRRSVRMSIREETFLIRPKSTALGNPSAC